MALRSLYADRVSETTTTTGTGTLTLNGAAISYQAFSTAFVGGGVRVDYCIVGADSSWEVGTGIYTAASTTLTRDTVFASSNSGALINLPAGTAQVFCDMPAQVIADIAFTLMAVGRMVPQ
jgi:hypothetical protein